jgi:hypothetical protein
MSFSNPWPYDDFKFCVKNGENFYQSWGGLPVVIFLGDDVQLSPVLDSPVYSSSFKLPAALHGVLVWKDFKYSSMNTLTYSR